MADDKRDRPPPVNYGGKVYGDVEFTAASNGVILKAPNGTRYRVQVNNVGTLTVTLI